MFVFNSDINLINHTALNGSNNMARHLSTCTIDPISSTTLGPIVYLSVVGQPVVVLNTNKAAADLFDRRADIYSDRWELTNLCLINGSG